MLIGLASVLIFARSINFGLARIDDYDYVVEHDEISGGAPAADLAWMFVNTEHGIFMPLTWASYLADYEIARHFLPSSPTLDEREAMAFRIMHVHSAILHGLNTILVFVFLWTLCSAIGIRNILAVSAATLAWSLHPLRVESVVWLSSRKDLVSFIFLILALILWLRWRRTEQPFFRSRAYWLSNLFCAIGAFGKPSVMIFPGLVFLIDLFLLRRISLRENGKWNVESFYPYTLPSALGFVIAVEATAFQNLGGAMAYPIPVWARVLNAFVSYGVYLKNSVFPCDLALQCILQHPRPPHFLIPGLVISGTCCWYFFKRFRAIIHDGLMVRNANLVFVGLLWFFGALVPFIGFVGFGYHAYADRFTYIPSLGISMILIALFIQFSSRFLRCAVCIMLGAVLGALSIRQMSFWESPIKLWNRTLAVDGANNTVANICLAEWNFDILHDVHAAVGCFDKAFAENPDFTCTFGTYYSIALSEAGMKDHLYKFYLYFRDWNAAKMRAENPNAPENAIIWGQDLAVVRTAMFLLETNGLKSAESELEELLKRCPENQDAHYLKGRIAEMKGDHSSAVAAWRKAVALTKPSKSFVRYRFLKDIIGK